MDELKKLTDEELAILYVKGNNRAFDLLLERNQARLFTYIKFMVGDEDTANDVFQDTFLKVITCLQEHRYTDTGKFSAWLIRIAHNLIIDIYRGQKSDKLKDVDKDNDMSKLGDKMMDGNIESSYVNREVLDDVKKMIDFLPDPQREVVFMRYYQMMPFKEIAAATDCSINTALGRMRYALINLRHMAKEHKMQLRMERY